MGQGVSLKEIVEKMNLKNLTPDVDLVEKYVQVPDINRPALQLSGYFDHFDSDRVQVIGYVEYTYLQTLEEAKKMKMYDELLSHKNSMPDLQPCIRTGSRAFRKGYTGGYTGSDHTKINILFHGGADSLDECETGTVYFHSRSTCGCVWCRCTDYGREWNR